MIEVSAQKVSKFGPIAKALNVELRPLSIFIGPTNTGKSYFASIIYDLLKSISSPSLYKRYLSEALSQQHSSKLHAIDQGNSLSWLNDLFDGANKEKHEFTQFNFSDVPKELQLWMNEILAEKN